jgi:hypothetical protein
MRIDSVRALKAELMRLPEVRRAATRASLPPAARTGPSALPPGPPASCLALGITGRRGRYRLAVRVQRAVPGLASTLDTIERRARGEVDVRVIGRVVKQAPWHRSRNRPLRIGGSISHASVTAGTLGCFVSRAAGDEGPDLILSNNHVLANENRARRGDPILQPGRADGGRARDDRVGTLDRFVRLRRTSNQVDAATASLDPDLEYYVDWLEGRGALAGVREEPLETGERVFKLGRTTGLSEGRISAVEVDDVVVGYDTGDLHFDDQLEIAPVGSEPFSLGGDSGSLIVDRRRRAVGLLFAGNDRDATFANPIDTVLDALDVDLAV